MNRTEYLLNAIKANTRAMIIATKYIERLEKQQDTLLTACGVAVLALTHSPIHPQDIVYIKRVIAQVEN